MKKKTRELNEKAHLGNGSTVKTLIGLEQVLMLGKVSAQIARQMAVEHEKVVSLLQLLRGIEDVVGRAHNHGIANETFVVRLGQVATELDSAQADAHGEDLVVLVLFVNVVDDHVEILVVAGTVRARRLELALDATVVHDHSCASEFDCLVHQMSYVVLFGRSSESGQNEKNDSVGRAQIGPVNGDQAAILGLEYLTNIVVRDAALNERKYDRVQR